MSSQLPIQPTINMGIVGHVDHGKTTLTKLLSGKDTDTHSEEKKRKITIKLGYTNFTIFKDSNKFSNKSGVPVKKVSIVDTPGHESFMATMISGSAIMDYALLLVAANEKCPQPQTIEHLKTLEISNIKGVIVIQNKVDLVTREEAIENFREIKKFLKGTFAENAPIIPMSAQHGANLSVLLENIVSHFKDPEREKGSDGRFYIVRSFDVNKPGTDFSKVQGGIVGGSIKSGSLKVGDEIEIRPGIKKKRDGKIFYKPIITKIESLYSGRDRLDEAFPGGSIAIKTKLDNVITKTDSLVGQIGGRNGTLPEPLDEIEITENLFDYVITSTSNLEVKPLYVSESLMIIVNSMTTVGSIVQKKNNKTRIKLKKPFMGFKGDRAVLFRRFEGNKWRIIGVGILE